MVSQTIKERRNSEFTTLQSTLSQVNSLGQVEVVLKTISTSNATLADGTTTCRKGICKIKMKVTFTQPVPSPKE